MTYSKEFIFLFIVVTVAVAAEFAEIKLCNQDWTFKIVCYN